VAVDHATYSLPPLCATIGGARALRMPTWPPVHLPATDRPISPTRPCRARLGASAISGLRGRRSSFGSAILADRSIRKPSRSCVRRSPGSPSLAFEWPVWCRELLSRWRASAGATESRPFVSRIPIFTVTALWALSEPIGGASCFRNRKAVAAALRRKRPDAPSAWRGHFKSTAMCCNSPVPRWSPLGAKSSGCTAARLLTIFPHRRSFLRGFPPNWLADE